MPNMQPIPAHGDKSSLQQRFGGKRSHVALCGLLGVMCLLWSGCGALEPLDEPEVTDLQLTVETLKASVRDAQRTASELRNELEASRQNLAEAQVARAQLEGRVREAERRLAESKQVIDLQREELAGARSERERFSRASVLMQGQLKQLQKQLSKHGKPGQAGPSPASVPARKTQNAMMMPAHAKPSTPQGGPSMTATPAALVEVPVLKEQGELGTRHITVKAGDTLWSLARRHYVDLDQLRALNQLKGNQIEVGQVLWLP